MSRNEQLASMMRRMNFCEERGSGVDRAIEQCELYQLPAPDFQKEDDFTRVIAQENYSIASRIIADTINEGLIKLEDTSKSRKYDQYMPIWG